MKTVQVYLPYSKQKDDLNQTLKSTKTNIEALEKQIWNMEEAANILTKIRNIVAFNNIEIEADNHCIFISGEEKIINKLIEENLAEETDFEEEEY